MGFLRYLGRGFRLAHTLWALLAAAFCVLLVVSEGGHPPAIILLPLVLAVWCVGHLALWGTSRLEARGRALRAKVRGETRSWPPGLMIALIGSGLVSCAGLVQLGGTLLLGEWYPFTGGLWAVAMSVSLAHGVCFVGLLLRLSWSRPASAALSAGWALLVVWQVSEQLIHGHRTDPADFAVLLAGIALPSFFAYHILSSRRIRAFFGPE